MAKIAQTVREHKKCIPSTIHAVLLVWNLSESCFTAKQLAPRRQERNPLLIKTILAYFDQMHFIFQMWRTGSKSLTWNFAEYAPKSLKSAGFWLKSFKNTRWSLLGHSVDKSRIAWCSGRIERHTSAHRSSCRALRSCSSSRSQFISGIRVVSIFSTSRSPLVVIVFVVVVVVSSLYAPAGCTEQRFSLLHTHAKNEGQFRIQQMHSFIVKHKLKRIHRVQKKVIHLFFHIFLTVFGQILRNFQRISASEYVNWW